MTEPTIPSWSAMKKYYKETGSAVFPLQDSIQKRDPRIDVNRKYAAYRRGDMDAVSDAQDTLDENSQYVDPMLASEPTDITDRNPIPATQPERKDIPVNRDKYEQDQFDKMKYEGKNISNNDNFLEYLANGSGYGTHYDPEVISRILDRMREYHARNIRTAAQGELKTKEAINSPDYLNVERQRVLIEPGRR